MAKTLLIIPTDLPSKAEEEKLAGKKARIEFTVLARAVRDHSPGEVEILDYNALRNDGRWFVKLASRYFGMPVAMVLSAFSRIGEFDSIFTYGENVGLSLGCLLALHGKRPAHVCLAFDPSKPNLRPFFKTLPAPHGIDTMVVACTALRDFAVSELGVKPDAVSVVPTFVDAEFYHPVNAGAPTYTAGSAGIAKRDYATLVRAATDLPAQTFGIVPAGHPLRLNRQAIPDVPIPDNVKFLEFEAGTLRDFYATCDIICMPVFDGHSTAGATALLEGMAMGKAVIATRSRGLSDYIIDGETGLFVGLGDVEGWKAAIRRLSADATLRQRLGQNARAWVEQNSALEKWAEAVAIALQSACTKRNQLGKTAAKPVEALRPSQPRSST